MPTLLLINGAPGSGKSTIASRVADSRPFTLALDIDVLKHALGQWETDPYAAGLQARRLALAVVVRHLHDGHHVVIGQYLARTEFIDELEAAAASCSARFVEVLLDLDSDELASRLDRRRRRPDRPEHAVNNQLVAPADAAFLAASLASLPQRRPNTIVIDARGPVEQVSAAVADLLD